MKELKFRAKMKKEFSLPNAGYDYFTLKELMSGKYDFRRYESFKKLGNTTEVIGILAIFILVLFVCLYCLGF